jgi:hypothetical protein
VIANVAAVAGLLPWTAGFIRDYTSPTLKILSLLSPFDLHTIPIILGHWAIGYPYANYDAGIAHLPGPVALGLLALATLAAVVAVGARLRQRGAGQRSAGARLDRRLVLALVLLLATPVAEAVISTFSSHIFGVRNLAASWPGLALCFAALLTAPGPRLRLAVIGLAVSAFAIGAVLMLSPTYSRPNYQAAADLVAGARPAVRVVIDETGEISPGPLTPLDVELSRRVALFRAGAPAERDHPYSFRDPIAPLSGAVSGAVAAAHGGPVAVVSTVLPSGAVIATRRQAATPVFPAPYRLVGTRVYGGIAPVAVRIYAERSRSA